MAKKSKKGITHPTPAVQKSLLRQKVFRMGVTWTENQLIETLRENLAASQSRKAYATSNAWAVLKSETQAQEDGIVPAVVDIEDNPTLYAAVTAVRAYLDSERKRTKQGAKQAKADKEGAKQAA